MKKVIIVAIFVFFFTAVVVKADFDMPMDFVITTETVNNYLNLTDVSATEGQMITVRAGVFAAVNNDSYVQTYNITYDTLASISDSNVSTICGDNEILDGSGTCISLVSNWNHTVPDTNASTACGNTGILFGDGKCLIPADGWNRTDQGNSSAQIRAAVDSDTNVTTACSDNEILDGSSSCITLSTWWNHTVPDTNASTKCSTGQLLNGDGNCVSYLDWTTDTNVTTACTDNQILDGSGSCISLSTWWNHTVPDTNASTKCASGQFLNGDGNCVNYFGWGVDTNASTKCASGQFLNGDGNCVNYFGWGIDTNATTQCGDNEILDGSGTCITLVSAWNWTVPDTNASTKCGTGELLNGDGNCVSYLDWTTDTNVSTACGNNEILLGDGKCLALSSDWNYTIPDTNASTKCSTGELLNGDGNCISYLDWTTDTNATTACGDNEILDGSGSCIALSTWWNHTIPDTNTSTACGDTGILFGDGKCLIPADGWNRTDQGNSSVEIEAVFNNSFSANLTTGNIIATNVVASGWVNASVGLNGTFYGDGTNLLISTSYFGYNITTEAGTHTGGNITSTQTYEGGVGGSYNVTEASGASPLQILANFSDVTTFDSVLTRHWYEGGLGHEIILEIYHVVNDEWEQLIEITDMEGFAPVNVPVIDPTNHINGTNGVSIRYRHVQNGIPSHKFYVDYLVLIDGTTTITTAEHDALSGRDSIVNHPWAFDTAATRAITGTIVNMTNNLIVAGYINSTDWKNVTITESQISDLAHIPDTNASTACGDNEILDGSGSCIALSTWWNHTIPDTNASTQCGAGELLNGDGNCVSYVDWTTDTNATTKCGTGELLNGDGNCVSYLDWTTDTNASTKCGTGELLNGDGNCVSYVDWTTDTNATTACGDNEILDGSGTCIVLVSNWNHTIPDTNATTKCSTGELLDGDGNCVNFQDWATDTNVSTACGNNEILLGDGKCLALSSDWNYTIPDTNASTKCGVGELLNGDGNCVSYVDWTTDTNATTACGDNEILDGSGTCITLLNLWNHTVPDTNATSCGTGELLDGDGNCVNFLDWSTDTNATTQCGDNEILDGSGTCVTLLNLWNHTVPDTNATTCNTGELLDGDGNCVSFVDWLTDTNASTACGTGQLLNGDGNCVSYVDWITDTNASTKCGSGEVLNGDGNCVNYLDWTTDTNASTKCSTGEFLNGDGACVSYAGWGVDTNITDTNASTGCSAREFLAGSTDGCIPYVDGWNGTYIASSGFLKTNDQFISANHTPITADTYGLGNLTAEWHDLYIGTGKAYFYPDQDEYVYSDGSYLIFGAGGTDEVYIDTGGNMGPWTAEGGNLGGTSNEWTNVYIGTGDYFMHTDANAWMGADGNNIEWGVGGSARVGLWATAFNPMNPDVVTLGGTAEEWASLYLGDTANIYFGLNQDTNLFRSGANILQTNDSFKVIGDLDVRSDSSALRLGASADWQIKRTAANQAQLAAGDSFGNTTFTGTVDMSSQWNITNVMNVTYGPASNVMQYWNGSCLITEGPTSTQELC